MSRFVDKTATDEVILKNDDRVQVRQRLTASEAAELDRYLTRVIVDSESGKVRTEEGEWHKTRVEICRSYITDWNFKDDDGKPIPFSRELIDQLDEDTIDELSRAIDILQKNRRETAEKKGKAS